MSKSHHKLLSSISHSFGPLFCRKIEAIKLPVTTALKARKGDRISRLGRQIFESRRIKGIFGTQLALSALIVPIITPSYSAAKTESPSETTVLTISPILTTEGPSLRYPIDDPQISQGFSFLHQAVDFRNPLGTPIFPIMQGIVVITQNTKVGYGKHIVVAHTNGYQSLYAHLSQINVKPGDIITTKTIIGLMGATGRATGNHLHLEIHQNGKPVNPKSLLGSL